MSPFVESGTPMSWARIERVKAGLPYFARSLFVDTVIMSSVLMRSPSMSKIQARTAWTLVIDINPTFVVVVVLFNAEGKLSRARCS